MFGCGLLTCFLNDNVWPERREIQTYLASTCSIQGDKESGVLDVEEISGYPVDLAPVKSPLRVLVSEVQPVVGSGHVIDLLFQTLDFVFEVPSLLLKLLC